MERLTSFLQGSSSIIQLLKIYGSPAAQERMAGELLHATQAFSAGEAR